MVVAAEQNRWCWNEMVALAVSWKQFINLVYVQYTLLLLPTYMSVLILVWILVDSDSLMVSWKQFINLALVLILTALSPPMIKISTPIISILTWRVAPATYMSVSSFSFSLKHFHTFWRLGSWPMLSSHVLGKKFINWSRFYVCWYGGLLVSRYHQRWWYLEINKTYRWSKLTTHLEANT